MYGSISAAQFSGKGMDTIFRDPAAEKFHKPVGGGGQVVGQHNIDDPGAESHPVIHREILLL